jgi:hypothetical protein
MDLSKPATAVVPSADADVLTVVAGTTRALTGREIQRLSGRSLQAVQNILKRMVAHGLLEVLEAGSAQLYRLNRDHVAADAAVALLDLRGRLFERIRQQLKQWPMPPAAAAVFGSAARGDGDPASDIDVLVVRPENVDETDRLWAGAVDDLARSILRWSGNRASIIQVTPAQISDMMHRNEPIVASLRRDSVLLTDTSPLTTPERAGSER